MAHNCDSKIIQYIQQHQDDPMSRTLKYIGRIDCVLFAQIYWTLFDRYGLKDLNYPIYTMELGKK